jgi:hypothetical protein
MSTILLQGGTVHKNGMGFEIWADPTFLNGYDPFEGLL